MSPLAAPYGPVFAPCSPCLVETGHGYFLTMVAMTDAVRTVRDWAVRLETALIDLGGQGNGLGEKARSLHLPPGLNRDLLNLTRIRNQVMHDGRDLSASQLDDFTRKAQQVLTALQTLGAAPASVGGRPGSSLRTAAAFFCLALMAVLFLGLILTTISLFTLPGPDRSGRFLSVLVTAGFEIVLWWAYRGFLKPMTR